MVTKPAACLIATMLCDEADFEQTARRHAEYCAESGEYSERLFAKKGRELQISYNLQLC